MRRVLARRPSPALIISVIALFVSMGGVSYGIANSVGSREIKNSSIRGVDMKRNSITAREIRRRSIDGTDIKLNRVGGNAVKEEVLEVSKLPKVPSAASADTAGSANSATTANTANNANNLGGNPPGAFASSAAGVTTAFMVDGGALENAFGPQPAFDSNVAGTDTFTFPYNINDGTHNVVVSGGGAGQTGGVAGMCFHYADPVDADTLDIESRTDAGALCSEEYTVVVY